MATRFEMSTEAKTILEIATKTKVGELVTYRDLHNATGVNDIGRLRGYIGTAFKRAFRNSGIRFKAERGIGYRRLDESGKNAEVSEKIGGIRKTTRRVKRLHDAVAFNALDALGKLTHVTNATQLAEMKKAASRSRRNKIATTASENNTVTAVIDGTLEMFRRKRA